MKLILSLSSLIIKSPHMTTYLMSMKLPLRLALGPLYWTSFELVLLTCFSLFSPLSLS
jgi:hypothetical protein